MARNEIVVSGDPKGHFLEGIIEGTPKPGTCLEIKPGAAVDGGGRPTFRVKQGGTDGDRGRVLILMAQSEWGKTKNDAVVSGDRVRVYEPVMGDELQVLCANLTGTGSGTLDAFAIGDKLIIDEGTGKCIKTTGSPQMEPFEVQETVSAIQADTHVLVTFTGN